MSQFHDRKNRKNYNNYGSWESTCLCVVKACRLYPSIVSIIMKHIHIHPLLQEILFLAGPFWVLIDQQWLCLKDTGVSPLRSVVVVVVVRPEAELHLEPKHVRWWFWWENWRETICEAVIWEPDFSARQTSEIWLELTRLRRDASMCVAPLIQSNTVVSLWNGDERAAKMSGWKVSAATIDDWRNILQHPHVFLPWWSVQTWGSFTATALTAKNKPVTC